MHRWFTKAPGFTKQAIESFTKEKVADPLLNCSVELIIVDLDFLTKIQILYE